MYQAIAKFFLIATLSASVPLFAAESASKSWRSKMQELSGALSDAIPFLYPDPNQDSKALTKRVMRIYAITKQLDGKLIHSNEIPDSDPALPYIANRLKGDIERANQSLQEGHADYAKAVVRSSVAYCIACHTRTKTGVQLPLLTAFNEPMKKASWIEKIEFQSATRQFDPVVTEVMKQLSNPGTTGISPLDLERASRIALSIAVRVKQDPDRSRFLATSIASSPSASVYLKEGSKQWIKDISEWQESRNQKFETENELIEAAQRLVADQSADKSALSSHSEVKFLRASVLMHDLLRRFPKSPYTAEALYTIGLSYESLQELGLWSLHEMYFLACIEKVPHTKLAEQCFKRYEQSVTLGFTGSSGIHVPRAVQSHLSRLRDLSSMHPTAK